MSHIGCPKENLPVAHCTVIQFHGACVQSEVCCEFSLKFAVQICASLYKSAPLTKAGVEGCSNGAAQDAEATTTQHNDALEAASSNARAASALGEKDSRLIEVEAQLTQAAYGAEAAGKPDLAVLSLKTLSLTASVASE